MLTPQAFRRLAVRLLPFDLALALVFTSAWFAVFGVDSIAGSLATALAAIAAHLTTGSVILVAMLRARTSPSALGELSDAALVELDQRLERRPLQTAFSCALGFVVLHLVLLAGSFGHASAPSFAARELLASAAMMVSTFFFGVLFLFPPVRISLGVRRGEIGLELDARGLSDRRPPSPLAPHLGLAVGFILTCPIVYALGISLGLEAGTPLPAHLGAELGALALLVLGVLIGVTLVLQSMNEILFGALDRVVTRLESLTTAASLAELEPLPVAHNDEFGRAAAALNHTLVELREIADAATAASHGNLQIPVSGEGQLQVAFRTMVARFDEMVSQIRDTALEVALAGSEIHAATEGQELAVVQQVDGIGEASVALMKLSDSAADIAKAAATVQADAERTVARADEVVAQITAFGEYIARIHELLELIREVADRSDILALNGSLEATRAGEAGRGFGLVVAEMRRLAERVTHAVTDVRKLIADIDASTTATVSATRDSRALVAGTSKAMAQIVEVTREQDGQTKQVSSSVIAVREIIEESATATMQTRATADRLRGQAEQLEHLIEHFDQSGRASSDFPRD